MSRLPVTAFKSMLSLREMSEMCEFLDGGRARRGFRRALCHSRVSSNIYEQFEATPRDLTVRYKHVSMGLFIFLLGKVVLFLTYYDHKHPLFCKNSMLK